MAINYNPNAFGTAAPVPTGNPGAGYNANPQPQGGSGVFGAVPGAVALPNPYANLASVFPNLTASNQGASSDILNNLTGTLSPDTLNQIQTTGAQDAFAQGLSGSGFAGNELLAGAANASQQEQATGASQYGQTIPQVTQTQTVAPSLEAEIAQFNAINAASPNPTLAGLTNLFGSVAGFGAGGGFGNLFGGGGGNILSGGTGNVDNALSASTQAYTDSLFANADSLFANAGAGGSNIPQEDQ